METVAISELRNNSISIIKKVQSGENVIITSRGHEMAQMLPLENKKQMAKEKLKELRKTAILGDVLSPLKNL